MNPGDLVPIIALMIPLVAVVGVTVRLTVKPIIEGMAKYRELQGGVAAADSQAMTMLDRRLGAIEDHLQNLDRSIGALEADADFRRQLESGSRATLPADPGR
jgi:hypothetical protein